jgi:hypothetical protein
MGGKAAPNTEQLLIQLDYSVDAHSIQQALFVLSTISRATRTALLPVIYSRAETKDIRSLSLLARSFKNHAVLGGHVKELDIR